MGQNLQNYFFYNIFYEISIIKVYFKFILKSYQFIFVKIIYYSYCIICLKIKKKYFQYMILGQF